MALTGLEAQFSLEMDGSDTRMFVLAVRQLTLISRLFNTASDHGLPLDSSTKTGVVLQEAQGRGGTKFHV